MPRFGSQDGGKLWDVAIIGAGMGGGLIARSLADAGHGVLLIDRGNEEFSALDPNAIADHPETLLAEGKWPTISAFEVDGKLNRCFIPYGSGVGGCTNLYAAALERFERHDVDSLPDMLHPTGGWPIRYDELLPYYERAEQLLHVAGSRDPLKKDETVDHLRSPAPLGPPDAGFMRTFEKRGLHPYRLHVGMRYRPGCDECLGRLCHNDCRADVRSVLAGGRIQPTILGRAEVLRLEASQDRVLRAVLVRGDGEITVRAKIFILAAGAIHTPQLLLNSRCEHWADGLANRSGLVGRNLMFHAVQKFAVWPTRRVKAVGPRKSIGFRDFYKVDGERLGSVQSTGFELTCRKIARHLCDSFDHSASRGLRTFRRVLRISAALIVQLLGPGTVFVCHIEDLPYPHNRVILDRNEADGVSIKYTISEELRVRVNRFCTLLEKHLDRHRTFFLSHDVELNFGHPCGTCVMGENPATSVVDRDCRAHGIANLFIGDASFMPTSGATNPGLTVAANALRVSDAIHRVLVSPDEINLSASDAVAS